MKSRLLNLARICRPFILALPVLLAGPAALAQDSGWYAGLSGGWADTSVERDSIVAGLHYQFNEDLLLRAELEPAGRVVVEVTGTRDVP